VRSVGIDSSLVSIADNPVGLMPVDARWATSAGPLCLSVRESYAPYGDRKLYISQPGETRWATHKSARSWLSKRPGTLLLRICRSCLRGAGVPMREQLLQ